MIKGFCESGIHLDTRLLARTLARHLERGHGGRLCVHESSAGWHCLAGSAFSPSAFALLMAANPQSALAGAP